MRDVHPVGLPSHAALGAAGLHLELRDIEAGQLHDPFMQETIKRVAARHVRLEIPRHDLAGTPPDTAPAGLIFHVARCGSTLASQLLKQHGQVVVYAEPLPFNELLVPPHKWSRADLVEALRALGAFFARHARMRYVLKLTSWNTLFCDVVADAFPATPWVLCVRDPLEVCVSLLERPPGWMRDGGASQLFRNVVDPARASDTRDDYAARVYAAFCEAVARLDASRGRLIAYEALPDAVWERVGPHFGLSFDDDLVRRMRAASRLYSKAPTDKAREFASDAARKRAAASPQLRGAVDAIARPALERLTDRFRFR